MGERRADELRKGDVLLLKGDRYTVVKAKRDRKHVRLTVDGRRGTFTHDVKGRTVYDVVDPAKESPKRAQESAPRDRSASPLHSSSGAQTRWAEISEADLEVPFDPNAVRSTDWSEPVSKQEARLINRLGAKLVAVEVEGGRLIVPPVTDTTVLGHLATMHGVRFDGVTFAEAKVWAKANPADPTPLSEVYGMLELEKAYAVHDAQHQDFASLKRPHWHREKAPR